MKRIPLFSDVPAEARGGWLGVAVSRTNEFVTERLLEGAVGELEAKGWTDIRVLDVAGSYELLGGVKALLDANARGVVALGAIIKGETPHFHYIADAVSHGLAAFAVQGHAVAFGILTTDTVQQAVDRAGGAQGNKGAEAARALLELLSGAARLAALR